MTITEFSRYAYRDVCRPFKTILCCTVAFVLVSLYPSDHSIRLGEAAPTDVQIVARWTDDYGRFAITALQVALPILIFSISKKKQDRSIDEFTISQPVLLLISIALFALPTPAE